MNNPFKTKKPSEETRGHDRFTIPQEKIVKFLSKKPDKTASNAELAKVCGKERPGNISSTLKLLRDKDFITTPERGLSKWTGKKR
jgi:hypothetical protein